MWSWRHPRLGVLLAAAVALGLRLSGIGFDGFAHQHPDERFLVMVAERLALPQALGEYLSPGRCPLNPSNAGFSFYVYGALFPAANRLLAEAFGVASYSGLLRTGRVLAAICDVAALLLLSAVAARFGGPRAGVAVAWLYAFCPLPLQQARFGTVDSLGMAAVALVLWGTTRPVSLRAAVGAGWAVGFAAAARPQLSALGVVVAASLLLDPWGKPRAFWAKRFAAVLLAAVAAVSSWKLLDPGFFAHCFSLEPSPARLASLRELARLVSGAGVFPPNLQWVGRSAFHKASDFLLWGVSPALGVTLLWALARAARRALAGDRKLWVPVFWVVLVGAAQLRQFVCSVRHLLPLLPFLLALMAFALGRLRRWLVALLLIATAAWGLAWARIAWQPYTRWEASGFLEKALPPGSTVLVEAWDDALPLGEAAKAFRFLEFDPYAEDGPSKLETLVDALARADAVVLSSQRAVGSLCRIPDAYPLTSEYYHLLFSGALGFRLAASFQRPLVLGPFRLSDLGAEEALSVYDHPPVWVFRKTEAFDPAKARSLLQRVPSPTVAPVWLPALEARGAPPYLEHRPASVARGARLPVSLFGQGASLVLWLAGCELFGLLGARVLQAAGFSPSLALFALGRWVGLALLGTCLLWLGSFGVPGWQWWGLGVLLGVAALERRRLFQLALHPQQWQVRGMFLSVFAVFLALRLANPAVYWGEKPMDMGFFAVLEKSPELPPQDPWFAGVPANYYWFGFLPYLALGRFSLAAPTLAYNLACATVPALTFLAAAAGGFLLVPSRLAAWLAGALGQLTGTAALLLRPGALFSPSFDAFWATTRRIGDNITEYPVWTAIFADLHAHFLGLCGLAAGLALTLALVSRKLLPARGFPLLGWVVGVEAMTNPWELPVLGVLVALAALLLSARSAARLWRLAAAGLGAWLLTWPFWMGQRFVPVRVFLEPLPFSQAEPLLELFGIHGAVLLAGLVLGWRSGSGGALRLACLVLVALALGLVALPFLLTFMDKMNTFFKFYLQAYLLMGVLGGGFLAASFQRAQRGWRRGLQGLGLALVGVGLVEAGWAAAGACGFPGWRRPLSLDGAAYLPARFPAIPRVCQALAEAGAEGVVAEEVGPPYSDTLRVPMFCGLPVLAGWRWHLWQRGKAETEILLRQADIRELLRGEKPAWYLQALIQRWRIRALVAWSPGAWSGHPCQPVPGVPEVRLCPP